jgi:FixJ family two-component response regulator
MNDTRQLIVVVEDDDGMRCALQRLLRASGFDTLVFESAEAFVSAQEARAPHCLVLDVRLPGTSGRTLTSGSGSGVLRLFRYVAR